MTQNVEMAELDLRYESFRMKNPALERKLLGSIQQDGIQEPLSGADPGTEHILLDGFKRLRCARKLGLRTVPYVALGQDQALAIMSLLHRGRPQPLTILEQARFVDELHVFHHMSVSDIAQQLSRSKSWVSLRLGLFEELTACRARETLRRAVSGLRLLVHHQAVHAHEQSSGRTASSSSSWPSAARD